MLIASDIHKYDYYLSQVITVILLVIKSYQIKYCSNLMTQQHVLGYCYYYYYIRLTAFFQDSLGKLAPEG